MAIGKSLAVAAVACVCLAAAPKRQPEALARLAPAERRAAARWMRGLSLRERVAQLVVVPFYGDAPGPRTKAWREFQHLVRDVRIGGLVLLNRVQNGVVRNAEPYATAAFLNRAQRLARIPLIVAGDFERGVSMRIAGTPRYPHAMAYGAGGHTEATRALGAATAREARALGFHWVLAPVADVNNNPDNPIINIRSFGEDPQTVSRHVRAFLEGLRADPRRRVLATLKHFPGHGDTAADTHLGLATITAGRERLDRVEFPPFRAGIAEGADSIMTAHIAVPALDPRPVPATVSEAILTNLLRKEWGFDGIIATDAMDMKGLSAGFSPAEAAVRSIEAGADVLLIPPRPEQAIQAVVAAVKSGRLSARRIDESLARVLAAKARVGLDRSRFVDLESIADAIDSPEDFESAQKAADAAVKVLKNGGGMLPLKDLGAACHLVLTENRLGLQGRRLLEELRARQPKAEAILLDPAMPDCELDAAAARALRCEKIVVEAFVSVAAYRGDVALSGGFPKLVETLIGSGRPVALVSLGNPYLLRKFPGLTAYVATYSTATTSEAAAIKALAGELPIR